MSVQPTITEFFNSRKRPAVDDPKKVGQPTKKVMILENFDRDVSNNVDSTKTESSSTTPSVRKIVYPVKEVVESASKLPAKLSQASSKKKALLKKTLDRSKRGGDIRKTFNKTINSHFSNKNVVSEVTNETLLKTETNPQEQNVVPKDVNETSENNPQETSVVISNETENELVVDTNSKESVCVEKTDVSDSTAKTISDVKKELNLGDIKAKLLKSSRYGEIKAALSRLNEGFSKLDKLKEKKTVVPNVQLKKCASIEIPVDVPSSSNLKSPVKSGMSQGSIREAVFKSPGSKLSMEPAYTSPRKYFENQSNKSPLKSPSKALAFQRYQALVSEDKSALTLPYKYRSLAELFRAVDTIVSMLYNRRETVTFPKLKRAVQEMLRRNLYEKHLAQFKTIYENAFNYQYEKIHTIGKMQPDNYELVVEPILKDTVNSDPNKEPEVGPRHMTPDVLLERRRKFYNYLLEKCKMEHEKFLLSLDPPIHVPKESLTRWHPEFDVDEVADIDPASLPEAPNVVKISTAKDVLERARNLFSVNPRMEKALQKFSEEQKNTTNNVQSSNNSCSTAAAVSKALKGIPKSLLEKVKAKQAAKALEAMTRTPTQAKEAVRLTRLPEMARIVRNIFILQKKSVLTRELVLKKISDSYKEHLNLCEFDEHLNLLQQKTPEWISFCKLRETDFVKFVKNADMSQVMAKLESLASNNSY